MALGGDCTATKKALRKFKQEQEDGQDHFMFEDEAHIPPEDNGIQRQTASQLARAKKGRDTGANYMSNAGMGGSRLMGGEIEEVKVGHTPS